MKLNFTRFLFVSLLIVPLTLFASNSKSGRATLARKLSYNTAASKRAFSAGNTDHANNIVINQNARTLIAPQGSRYEWKRDQKIISSKKELAVAESGIYSVTVTDQAGVKASYTTAVVVTGATIQRVFLIGDSTVANYASGYYPQTGWGQVFQSFFTSNVQVNNMAVGGTSAKSFYNTYWTAIKDGLQAGDFVFIQFGINDGNKTDATRYEAAFGGFTTYLTSYVNEARAKGAIPILVSTINRNAYASFDPPIVYPSYHDYPVATRQLAQSSLNVPLVDLDQLTRSFMEKVGDLYTTNHMYLFADSGEYPRFPTGSADQVHLKEMGAIKVAKFVASTIKGLSSHPDVGRLAAELAPTYPVTIAENIPGSQTLTLTDTLPAGLNLTIKSKAKSGYNLLKWIDENGYPVSLSKMFYYSMEAKPKSFTAVYSTTETQVPGLVIEEGSMGFCGVDGAVDNNLAGFKGTGFANGTNAAGTGINWKINVSEAGQHYVYFRYLNGLADRTARILVNGTVALASVNFPFSDSKWSNVIVNLNLDKGIKEIRLEAISTTGLPNIDNIGFIDKFPQPLTCGGGIDVSKSLEVVNWSMRSLGGNSSSANNLKQKTNAVKVLKSIGADIYALNDIVDTTAIADIASQIGFNATEYAYSVSKYGSNASSVSDPAYATSTKSAFIYRKSVISPLGAPKPLHFTSNPADSLYQAWASGRFPMELKAMVTLDGISKKVSFINIHGASDADQNGYSKRSIAARNLKSYLDANSSGANFLLLGNFNDDLDSTISSYQTVGTKVSSYNTFLNDTIYTALTLPLSVAGNGSVVGSIHVTDHVIASKSMSGLYISGTSKIFNQLDAVVSPDNFNSTTSDHYPVLTRFAFQNGAPQKIAAFDVYAREGRNYLKWMNAASVKSQEYQILRSKDGDTFQRIDSISILSPVAGATYSSADEQAGFGITYYQIKMKEENGNINFSEIRSVVPFDASKLPDGNYFIRRAGSDLFYTRPTSYVGTATQLTFQVANADANLQKWRFSYDATKGRYKISPASANLSQSSFVRETGGLSDGDALVYSNGTHSFTLYYNEATRSYAVFTAEAPGLSQWSVALDSSTPAVLGFTSTTNANMRDIGTPLHYLFDIIPVPALAEQKITFPAMDAKKVGDSDFDPAASSSSGLAITYSSSNTGVATIVEGKVHIVGPGIATIIARQAGNATYEPQYSSQLLKVKNANQSLVALYKFDDNLSDESGNSNHAFTPGKTWAGATGTLAYESGKVIEAGKTNKALRIGGSPATIALPTGVFGLYDNFTISTWIKRETNTNWQRVFDFGFNTTAYAFLSANVGATNQKIKFGIKAGSSAEQYVQTSTAALIPANSTWVHVAVVFNNLTATTYSAKIYINGVESPNDGLGNAASGFTVKPTDVGITNQNFLGKAQFAGDTYMVGSYDDFRIYNYALSPTQVNAVLPVELINFSAKAGSSGSINLNWRTASEKNNRSFLVERSTDGKTFYKLENVLAKSEHGASYSLVDYTPVNGVNYYRLSQTDASGETTILGIQSVNVSLSRSNELSVYPNPITGNRLSFRYFNEVLGSINVKLLSLDGKLVLEQSLQKNIENEYSLNTGTLTPGVYILSVNGSSFRVLQR